MSRSALDPHLARGLDEVPTHVPPMPLASPSRGPDRQLRLVPEIMEQASQGECLGVPDHAVRIWNASCRRSERAYLRQAKIQLQRGHAALEIDLVCAAHQHAEAGQFVGRVVRGTGRIVGTCRQGIRLTMYIGRESRNIHRRARLFAHAKRSQLSAISSPSAACRPGAASSITWSATLKPRIASVAPDAAASPRPLSHGFAVEATGLFVRTC